MNNIDILEEKEKKAYDNLIMLKYFTMEKEDKESIDIILKLVETLIAENKELDKFIKEGITIEPNSPYKNFQLNYLRENFIPKSKVEELIEEVKEDENPSISSFQEYAQEYAIDKLQSLLGKE